MKFLVDEFLSVASVDMAVEAGHPESAHVSQRVIRVDHRTVWNVVHSLGFSFKATFKPTRQPEAAMARRRGCWNRHRKRIGSNWLVFITALCGSRIDAPGVLDGSAGGDAFPVQVER